jgi:hypothetical protein
VCRAWSGRETHFDARGTRFRIRMPLTLKTRHGPVRYKEVNGIQGHGTATGPIKVDSRDSHNDMNRVEQMGLSATIPPTRIRRRVADY